MKTRFLIISLLVVLVLAMTLPASAQNIVVTVGDSHEEHGSSFVETLNEREITRWWGVFPPRIIGYSATEKETSGESNGYVDTSYRGAYTADMGGGSGFSRETVEAQSEGHVDSTTTATTWERTAPLQTRVTRTEIEAHEDWWSAFDSNTTTLWRPAP